MPIFWKGTLQQYVGRFHRLHEGKKVIEVYEYVDADALMLARMCGRRPKATRTWGTRSYRIRSVSSICTSRLRSSRQLSPAAPYATSATTAKLPKSRGLSHPNAKNATHDNTIYLPRA